jgi:hypothetical protein
MPSQRFLLFEICLLLFISCASHQCLAQNATATLTGTVVDENGAVVPAVEVSVINMATSLERTATTSEQGYFTLLLLPPGKYTITAKRDGFSAVKIPDVVLNVGDNKQIQIQLKAGDVNVEVTVDSGEQPVRTDGSVGTVINRQFVANIPLNGRSLQALIQLTPGVVLTKANSPNATGASQFSVNGQRVTSNYFMVDGVSANTGVNSGNQVTAGDAGSGVTAGTTALGGTNSLVSLDALQEFRIETSSYSAEYGRTPGGQISLVTRGGTNQFHGSVSEYFRNEALDANDWFANANRLPKPKERQNLFGGVFGGPIKKDRLFFFTSYEGLQLQQPQAQLVTVPTTATRTQAVPAARPYLNALPVPNGQDFGNGTARFAASYSNPGTFNIFSLRLDGQVVQNVTGFFRFSHAPSEMKIRGGSLSTVSSIQAVNNSYTGGLVWLPVSSLVVDGRFNWTRNSARFFSDLEAFGGAVVPNASDIFLPGRNPSSAAFAFSYSPGGSFSWGPGTTDVQRQFNAVGTVAWSVGAHQLKFGGDYRRMLPLFGGPGGFRESLFFRNLAGLRDGLAFRYIVTNSEAVQREAIFSNLSLFAQDAWRLGPRLTLTLGLRFERITQPGEATGQLPRTVLGIETDVLQNPRLAPVGTPLFRNPASGLAPRFGVAYQLGRRVGWESSLRGGMGLFYDLPLGQIANAFSNFVYPWSAQKLTSNLSFPLSDTVRTPPALGVDPPAQLNLLDPNLRLPYTIQWNASWEQGIGAAQTLSLSYVGANARRLLIVQNYQQSLADFPGAIVQLAVQRNLASSKYEALQVQYRRRLRNGLQGLASYTLSRSRDNASAGGSSLPPATQAQLLAQEYGPSDFDVRHLFSGAITYDLPRISGSGILQSVLNDWGWDLLVRYQSAFPVDVAAGSLVVDNVQFSVRPDLVLGQPLYISDATSPGGRRFNAAAFVLPAASKQGNFPRNELRGFSASQVDVALRREFKVGERLRLQLRGELFNVFNHPNFGTPGRFLDTPSEFGRPTQMLNASLSGLNALYQMGGPRSGQLAIKVLW